MTVPLQEGESSSIWLNQKMGKKKNFHLFQATLMDFKTAKPSRAVWQGKQWWQLQLLAQGEKGLGKELAIPKRTPQCQGQARRMEQKWGGCGCSVVGEHKKRVCLKWSLLLGGVGKQKSSHRGSILIKLAVLHGFPARPALLLLVRTSPMDENW